MQQEKILQEITVIQYPMKAQYLQKDRVIILGENECSIVNPRTNQEIIKINNDFCSKYSSSFALCPDKKKVALSYEKTVKIYDTDTGNQEWSTTESNYINDITFDPIERAIFLACGTCCASHTIIKHNYIINKRTKIYSGDFILSNIALHPKENILCTGNIKGEIFLYASNDLKPNLKGDKLKNSPVATYYYSHDGSFILAHGIRDIYIINTDLTNLSSSFTGKHNNKRFCDIKLNIDSTILTIISSIKQKDHFFAIEYYDITTKKCIYSAKIEKNEEKFFDGNLSFSPDESELMIVVNGKCIIVPVPFEVNKKRATFIYWILENYQKNNPEIPHDVILCIALRL